MGVLVVVSASLLILISGIHVYWAFGGKWAVNAVIPVSKEERPMLRPGEIGTFAVALLLLAAALALVVESGMLELQPLRMAAGWASWACLIVFALRGVGDFNYMGLFKRVKGSRFSKCDTWLYTPLCMYLAFTYLLVLLVR